MAALKPFKQDQFSPLAVFCFFSSSHSEIQLLGPWMFLAVEAAKQSCPRGVQGRQFTPGHTDLELV